MKQQASAVKERPACSEKSMPIPELLVCPECLSEVELWSDEEDTTCSCGKRLLRNNKG